MFIRRLAVLGTILALLWPLSLSASTVHKTKQFGEPRPDKALVYVIREKAFVGGGVGMFIFADEQFIAFVRNGTYSFGYVDPGLHLLWGDTPSGLEVQLIAGETYYVGAKAVNPITLMTEAEGKKAIETVASFIESDQTDLDNAAKKVAKRHDHVIYEPNVYVWSAFANADDHRACEVLRRHYYTSVQGDNPQLTAVEDALKAAGIEAPRVFKKERGRRAKRVDIQLTTEMLGHAHRGNYDLAILVAGDEDYVPLVEAVQREGKRVVVWFLPHGLSPALVRAADLAYDMSGILFEETRILTQRS